MDEIAERTKRLRDRYRRDNDLILRPAQVIAVNGSIYDPAYPGKVWVIEPGPTGFTAPRSVFPPTQQGIILTPGQSVRLGTNLRGQDYIVEYDSTALLAKGQSPVPQQPKDKVPQGVIQTLAVVPADPPSLVLSVRAWNPIIGNTLYMFPGVTLAALTAPSAGQMYYACIFVKADYTNYEVKYSTARSQIDVPLGLSDVQECLNAKTPGSTPVWAQKLIGGQSTISQADLEADGVPLQQLVNTDDGVYNATVSTTDATVTSLFVLTVPSGVSVTIKAKVTARRTGGSSGSAGDSAGYERIATVADISGTATLIGSVSPPHTAESQAGWDCTIDVTGATARVRVTGAASNNVNWAGKIEVEQVS